LLSGEHNVNSPHHPRRHRPRRHPLPSPTSVPVISEDEFIKCVKQSNAALSVKFLCNPMITVAKQTHHYYKDG
jgi:hypothetical protein